MSLTSDFVINITNSTVQVSDEYSNLEFPRGSYDSILKFLIELDNDELNDMFEYLMIKQNRLVVTRNGYIDFIYNYEEYKDMLEVFGPLTINEED